MTTTNANDLRCKHETVKLTSNQTANSTVDPATYLKAKPLLVLASSYMCDAWGVLIGTDFEVDAARIDRLTRELVEALRDAAQGVGPSSI